ncbi:ABC-type dipeptide transport system, periplasmic component [Halogeometricum borinquense DSM 11551]|uniref:ABC-type dipeptide transport system, periplasmic component n=2 Tax=Halogeometricum borinquense TaxID=60847 RepID=E4NW37_HALBP|nr:hypothetical protein [Halogeometricum borinquense]ADQ69257.1 ABC-type dipeptide transport system, periplasmic component [Halogeometricum borinquense DSM 11551]ELY31555.1 ABC-type dipeptide transport system, periplasmic component [Halogeometricum borinquense DSM 11551]RYJ08338.1 peptide ABC transporter substrate-binding protein [Halogeometricum borinquense]
MHEILQKRVFNAPDVCLNCHRRIRVERNRPERQYSTDASTSESKWARNRKTTTVAYGPADAVSDAKGIWCDCGVEGSYVRIWDDEPLPEDENKTADVNAEQFRRLVQATIRILEDKGITLDRQAFASHALQARHDGDCVTESLSAGTSHAIVRVSEASRKRVTA